MSRIHPTGECLVGQRILDHGTTLWEQGRSLILGENVVALTVAELLSLTSIPDVEDVSLKTIAEFYEAHLMGRQFLFRVKHKVGEIRVRFETGQLPHLIGLDHFRLGKPSHQIHNDLLTEEITFKKLEEKNEGQFEKDKSRMLALPLVHQLIHSPNSLVFIEVNPTTDSVHANFYLIGSPGHVWIQLKLRKQKEKDTFYAPVSMAVHRRPPDMKRIGIKEVSERPFDEAW